MENNFKCPRCKKMVKVGKRLRASYTCQYCGRGMVITREERSQGFANYKRNFFLSNRRPYQGTQRNRGFNETRKQETNV